jgi:hypothetical protein
VNEPIDLEEHAYDKAYDIRDDEARDAWAQREAER